MHTCSYSTCSIKLCIFAIAFVNSLLYIIQYRNLKEKNFDQNYFRIGSVATLETIVFYSTLVAWIILILSTILGAQWGIFAVGKQIFIDPKVIFSTIITLLYGVYIFIRIKNGYHKEILSTLTLYYFVCV